MLNTKIVISEIDYEKSFENLFPLAMEKCAQMENPNMPVRFLLKMGNASMKEAVLSILNHMSEEAKGELLCVLVNLYGRELQMALNEFLQNDELGKNIVIGDFYMTQDLEKHPILIGSSIKIDYSNLVKNDSVKQKIGGFAKDMISKTKLGGSEKLKNFVKDTAGSVAELAVGTAPMFVENKALSLINTQENKARLLHMAEQVLEKKGIYVKLGDFDFEQESMTDIQDKAVVEEIKERKPELSVALEDELLDAVVRYLKTI